MELNTNAYKYKPLLEQGAIRLLLLHPSPNLETVVECSIVHTTLEICDDDVVEHYSALSYVWGFPDATRVISVEGQDFQVTANLDSALRHIRDRRRCHRLWVDAICINQADNEEKSIQVTQMGEVYKFAHNTIIYLGAPAANTDHLLMSTRLPTSQPDASQAWIPLLKRSWFSRVWIYQELMFSRDPWVQCGSVRTRWDLLLKAASSQTEFNPRVEPWKTLYILATERNLMANLKERAHLNFADALLRILEARRGGGVSDARDILFAILGTLQTSKEDGELNDRSLLQIDYSKTTSQVYEDIAKFLIIANENYSVLSYVETENEISPVASWAPNWRAKSLPYPYHRLRNTLTTILTGFESTVQLQVKKKATKFNYWALKQCSSGEGIPDSHCWNSSLFACVGVQIGQIYILSKPIMYDEAALNIHLNDIVVDVTPESFEATARRVYMHWQELLGDSFREVFEPLNHPTQLFSSWAIRSLTERGIQAASGEGIPQSGGILGLQKIAAHLFLHATQRDTGFYPHFLHGRRLGLLYNGTPILVPQLAQEDDIVCAFFGDLTSPFTLRSRNSVLNKTEVEKEIRNKMFLKLETNITHCDFIGECFVDNWMFANGEGLPMEGRKSHEPQIFALH